MVLQDRSVKHKIRQLHVNAITSKQRRLLVISGCEHWCCLQAHMVLENISPTYLLWVGRDSLHENTTDSSYTSDIITSCQFKPWLGRETGHLVFNAWSGFDADSFGALSGTVKAGGLLLLLTPPLHNWHDYNDPEYQRIMVYPDNNKALAGRYLARLSKLIINNTDISLLEENGHCRFQDSCTTYENVEHNYNDGCKTEAQSRAVLAIKSVANGHRRRPLVLTADRGRGKSAALGLAAASLMNEGCVHIIITAPAMISANVIFKHAADRLVITDERKSVIRTENSLLIFKAPDELVANPESCNLLLIDEAAAIPVPLLTALLKAYSRVVFSSTIHGYEGTGRGFSIRFRQTLNELTPKWKALHLSEPVRWAVNDPLERFTFDALMLDASPIDVKTLATINWQQWQFEQIDRDKLVSDNKLLREIFGLLMLAHYKTRPMDLRHLLDGTNITVYALKVDGYVLGVALIALEGEIESKLADDIWMGYRRVRGHLMPQSLSNHLGVRKATELKAARVIRIAIHPEFQRKGIGIEFVKTIVDDLKSKGVDYIGCIFGATAILLDFWHKAELNPLRIGLTSDSLSNGHSVIVLKPITDQGFSLWDEGLERFSKQLPYLLTDGIQNLDGEIVIRLLRNLKIMDVRLDQADWYDITSFSEGMRLYESCIVSLKKLSLLTLVSAPEITCLEDNDWLLLVYKVMQNKPWLEVVKLLSFTGKKYATKQLRKVARALVNAYK